MKNGHGIIKRIGDLIFPPVCASCGKLTDIESIGVYGSTLCPECAEELGDELIKSCPKCSKPRMLCRCMPDLILKSGADACIKCLVYRKGDYDNVVNKIIYHIKHQKDASAFSLAAKIMSSAVMGEISGENTVFTYAPRRKSAIREDGFDQAERLSHYLASFCGGKREKLFVRIGGSEQKKLSGAEREENTKNAFMLNAGADVKGREIVIVDDMITTGASLGACTKILKDAGAGKVICLSLAYSQFDQMGNGE